MTQGSGVSPVPPPLPEGSIGEATEELACARARGDAEAIAEALVRLALLHFRQARYPRTVALAEEALQLAPAACPARCDALRILGNSAAETGHPDEAETRYHEAADLARELGDGRALARCLHSLATNVYWPRGQFRRCLAAGKAALAEAQRLDLRDELWFSLADIAWAHWSMGELGLAAEIADQLAAVVVPGSLGDGFRLCLEAGIMVPVAGEIDAPLARYAAARQIAETTGDPGLSVEVRLGLARLYRAIGDRAAAIAWANDAVAVAGQLAYRQFQAAVLIERGRTLLELGDDARAGTDFEAALAVALELQAAFDESRARLGLAAIRSRAGSPDAGDAWRQVAALVLEHGYPFLVQQERSLVLPWIAQALDAGDPEAAAAAASLYEIVGSVPPAALHVRTLGQFTLRLGPTTVPRERLRQRRAGELLALLLTSPGHTLSAGQVAEAMCPEKDPRGAVDFYHHAISALRRLLEPDLPDRRFRCRYLDVSDERVTLVLAPGSEIDLDGFRGVHPAAGLGGRRGAVRRGVPPALPRGGVDHPHPPAPGRPARAGPPRARVRPARRRRGSGVPRPRPADRRREPVA